MYTVLEINHPDKRIKELIAHFRVNMGWFFTVLLDNTNIVYSFTKVNIATEPLFSFSGVFTTPIKNFYIGDAAYIEKLGLRFTYEQILGKVKKLNDNLPPTTQKNEDTSQIC
jgi:hypothetical protein